MAFVTSKGSSIVNATVIDKHPSKSENFSVVCSPVPFNFFLFASKGSNSSYG